MGEPIKIRKVINISLSAEEHLALRKAMLDEGISLSEFFARYARQHLARKHNKSKGIAELEQVQQK